MHEIRRDDQQCSLTGGSLYKILVLYYMHTVYENAYRHNYLLNRPSVICGICACMKTVVYVYAMHYTG